VKEVEMAVTCNMQGADEINILDFNLKTGRNKPLWRPRCRWEGNIKRELKAVWHEGPVVGCCEHGNET
jgi:hypothetical protein